MEKTSMDEVVTDEHYESMLEELKAEIKGLQDRQTNMEKEDKQLDKWVVHVKNHIDHSTSVKPADLGIAPSKEYAHCQTQTDIITTSEHEDEHMLKRLEAEIKVLRQNDELSTKETNLILDELEVSMKTSEDNIHALIELVHDKDEQLERWENGSGMVENSSSDYHSDFMAPAVEAMQPQDVIKGDIEAPTPAQAQIQAPAEANWTDLAHQVKAQIPPQPRAEVQAQTVARVVALGRAKGQAWRHAQAEAYARVQMTQSPAQARTQVNWEALTAQVQQAQVQAKVHVKATVQTLSKHCPQVGCHGQAHNQGQGQALGSVEVLGNTEGHAQAHTRTPGWLLAQSQNESQTLNRVQTQAQEQNHTQNRAHIQDPVHAVVEGQPQMFAKGQAYDMGVEALAEVHVQSKAYARARAQVQALVQALGQGSLETKALAEDVSKALEVMEASIAAQIEGQDHALPDAQVQVLLLTLGQVMPWGRAQDWEQAGVQAVEKGLIEAWDQARKCPQIQAQTEDSIPVVPDRPQALTQGQEDTLAEVVANALAELLVEGQAHAQAHAQVLTLVDTLDQAAHHAQTLAEYFREALVAVSTTMETRKFYGIARTQVQELVEASSRGAPKAQAEHRAQTLATDLRRALAKAQAMDQADI